MILNDNEMSIAPPVGAMSTYLTRLLSSPTYMSLRDIGKQVAEHLPPFLKERAYRAEELGARFRHWRHLFEELGFYYVGVSTATTRSARAGFTKRPRRQRRPDPRPRAHAKRQRLRAGGSSADKYHGVVKFDVATGKQKKSAVDRAVVHQSVRPIPGEGGAEGPAHRRHHRGDAGGPASTFSPRLFRSAPSTSALPSSTP